MKVSYHDMYKYLTFGDYVFIFKHKIQVMRKKEKATGYAALHERYPISERDEAIDKCNSLNVIEAKKRDGGAA